MKKYKIATLGSHSALQILKGAKDEGFESVLIGIKGRTEPYTSFRVADKVYEIEKFKDFFELEEELIKQNCILIVHGSFVEFLGTENVEKIRVPHYGNSNILKWESDRNMEREWLLGANLNLPRIFKTPEDIDRPVIIKFHGAGGGKGYFLANSAREFYEKFERYEDEDRDFVIQEYIVGVPVYAHYFYSRLNDELEIMSFDKRYESNADSIGRIKAKDQLTVGIQTSYTITGNIPIVVRESMLPRFFEMGKNVIRESKILEKGGLYGPFCLECIIDNHLEFYVFEISARIVAGTNPYVSGSPYTDLRYDVPMSTGRRIARDIKEAIAADNLDAVLS
jgi:5-formaminoimidazole-4-carboxamide-1-(beta)-D-ribofuranosyl 5'-monophosphate synthetase